MTILARNLRVGHLEIDLLARDGPAVVLIEVRTRGAGSWGSALGSVNPAKQRRLRAAAGLLWSRRFARAAGVERMRFDVAAVDLDAGPSPVVEYVQGAF
ncbi:MAG: YraN family protein [Deltaproteobacteria bacterium]|nr:YraN family protein [Deltaproteobacteria bacterium]